MILQDRDGYKLVHHARDDCRQVRAEPAVVVLRMLRGGKAQMHELVRIVACDVLREFGRIAAGIVDAVDRDLLIAIAGAARRPANAVHFALAHHLRVTRLDELVGIALENDDVPRPNADLLETANDFENDLRTGNGADELRPALVAATDRVHFDSDHFAR